MEQLETLVNTYQMPAEAKTLLTEHPPLIICGVSGAGKDTIAQYLMQSGDYAHIVSHTTRAPRPHHDGHEVNGVDYWFINEQTATVMLQDKSFIEAEFVHGDTVYGTSIEAYKRVVEHGRKPLLEIDIKGVTNLQTQVPSLDAVFLVPPDFATWQRRLEGRGEMSDAEKRKRLESAVAEFKAFLARDSGFIPVINTEVVDTAQAIEDGSYKTEVSMSRARAAVEQLSRETEALLATS
jgi:guanylate kinase